MLRFFEDSADLTADVSGLASDEMVASFGTHDSTSVHDAFILIFSVNGLSSQNSVLLTAFTAAGSAETDTNPLFSLLQESGTRSTRSLYLSKISFPSDSSQPRSHWL